MKTIASTLETPTTIIPISKITGLLMEEEIEDMIIIFKSQPSISDLLKNKSEKKDRTIRERKSLLLWVTLLIC